jgi:hypothetical protein
MERDKGNPMKAHTTKHASIRAQQRGIRQSDRDLIFQFGDREEQVGGGCYRLTISSKKLKLLISQGVVPPQLGDRCARLVLVTDGSRLVTNYKQDL